jgi:myosin heavy subunit
MKKTKERAAISEEIHQMKESNSTFTLPQQRCESLRKETVEKKKKREMEECLTQSMTSECIEGFELEQIQQDQAINGNEMVRLERARALKLGQKEVASTPNGHEMLAEAQLLASNFSVGELSASLARVRTQAFVLEERARKLQAQLQESQQMQGKMQRLLSEVRDRQERYKEATDHVKRRQSHYDRLETKQEKLGDLDISIALLEKSADAHMSKYMEAATKVKMFGGGGESAAMDGFNNVLAVFRHGRGEDYFIYGSRIAHAETMLRLEQEASMELHTATLDLDACAHDINANTAQAEKLSRDLASWKQYLKQQSHEAARSFGRSLSLLNISGSLKIDHNNRNLLINVAGAKMQYR